MRKLNREDLIFAAPLAGIALGAGLGKFAAVFGPSAEALQAGVGPFLAPMVTGDNCALVGGTIGLMVSVLAVALVMRG